MKSSADCDFEKTEEKGLNETKGSNSSNSDPSLCRICHSGPSNGKLISPCNCKGTIGFVHRHCVETWLSVSREETCEICGFQYCTRVIHPTFSSWWRDPESLVDRRQLLGDCVCFLTLTPLAAISASQCASGAIHLFNNAEKTVIECFCLFIVTIFLATVYILWVVVVASHHYEIFYKYQCDQMVIKLDGYSSASICDSGFAEDEESNNGPGGRIRTRSYPEVCRERDLENSPELVPPAGPPHEQQSQQSRTRRHLGLRAREIPRRSSYPAINQSQRNLRRE